MSGRLRAREDEGQRVTVEHDDRGRVLRAAHSFGRPLVFSYDTLTVAVAWPPRDREHALRVAAEHYAFCPELLAARPLEDHAADLLRAGAWLSWWN